MLVNTSATIPAALDGLLPAGDLIVIGGAGHMGPLTHAPLVFAGIARHIAKAEAGMPHEPDTLGATPRPAGSVWNAA